MSQSELQIEKPKRKGRPKMTAAQKLASKAKRDAEKSEDPFTKAKRPYTKSGVVADRGVPCFHCSNPHGHSKQHKYPNGNQRYICGKCRKPFIVRKIG
jgi:hypothetical protein